MVRPHTSSATDPPGPPRAPTSPASASEVRCKGCRKLIDEADHFCRYCGKARSGGEAWYYRPRWILILTFTALGPFALILVWKSPKMSLPAKISMALFIIVTTVIVVYLFVALGTVLLRSWRQLDEALSGF